MSGLFEQSGFTKNQRKYLFYLICVFFRMFLAGIVYNFSKNRKIQYAVLIAGIIGIYTNYSKLNENVWWNRKFHLIISILLTITSYMIITKKINDLKYPSYILYADVLFGLFHSYITNENWN